MRFFLCIASVLLALGGAAQAASIFLTGHDPDFHATRGPDVPGAINLNNVAIDFILDPAFNSVVAGGTSKFLFVESNIPIPSGHADGELGIIASGYTSGTDYEKHDASTLDAELDLLGSKYAGIVVASDFGGLLTQAELDILNARSTDIIDFLNDDNGGIYAMAQGNSGARLTPGGGFYGFLPFVISSAAVNQNEQGNTVTAFGASIGLVDDDINGNFSHTIFEDTGGLNIVDIDDQGRILSLAGRGQVDPNTGLNPVPVPAPLAMLGSGLLLLGWFRRNRKPTGRAQTV